jgi:hypothetical protein
LSSSKRMRCGICGNGNVLSALGSRFRVACFARYLDDKNRNSLSLIL